MAGYYEQLEAQLVNATERAAPRRRRSPRLTAQRRLAWRWRADWLAVAFALACSVVVVVVFTQVGVSARHPPRPKPSAPPAGLVGLPVIRNYAPGTPPAMGGALQCDSSLTAPGRATSPAGKAVVNTRGATRFVYRITASGLAAGRREEIYEVWLRPATRAGNGAYILLNGEAPVLLGRIAPAVGASGRLVAQGVTSPSLTDGDYVLLVTLQPASMKAPGHVVLEGDLPL